MIHETFSYEHYSREGTQSVLIDEVERYDDPKGTMYRLSITQNPLVSGNEIFYLSRDETKKLFDQLLPEFMIKATNEDGTVEYEEEHEEVFALTPRGRAIVDGLKLVRTVIKTNKYEDGGEVTETTEIYE
jgi:hypothetical protein